MAVPGVIPRGNFNDYEECYQDYQKSADAILQMSQAFQRNASQFSAQGRHGLHSKGIVLISLLLMAGAAALVAKGFIVSGIIVGILFVLALIGKYFAISNTDFSAQEGIGE